MTTTALIPIADHVVVRPDEAETKTPGGIVLPDTAKERPQRGTVLAVGSGQLLDNGTRVPPEVKEGDAVLYRRYEGTIIEVDGKELVVLKEEHLLAKLMAGK